MDSHFKSPIPPPFHRGVTRQIKPPNLQTSKQLSTVSWQKSRALAKGFARAEVRRRLLVYSCFRARPRAAMLRRRGQAQVRRIEETGCTADAHRAVASLSNLGLLSTAFFMRSSKEAIRKLKRAGGTSRGLRSARARRVGVGHASLASQARTLQWTHPYALPHGKHRSLIY